MPQHPAGRPLRVVLYCRVSADPKHRGKSPADQERELRDWVAVESWELVEVVQETGSASRYQRKERKRWPEVAQIIGSGRVDALLTWENSRASRELGEYVELRNVCAEHKVLWGYGDTLYDMNKPRDRKRTANDAVDSEHEAGVISEHALKGIRGAVLAGRPPMGTALDGYVRDHDPRTGDLIGQSINPERAAIVREAAERVLAGHATSRVVRDFNERGLLTARGRHFTVGNLRQLLLRPGLAGFRVHRGEIASKGDWEPILTPEQHHALVALYGDPTRKTYIEGNVKHLLTGIARCGICERPVKRMATRGVEYYLCWSGEVGRKKDFVDEIVIRYIVKRLQRPDCLDVFAEPDDGVIAAAEKEAAMLRARMDAFYSRAAKGQLSDAGLAKIEVELLPEIERAERAAVRTHIPAVLREIAGRPDAEARFKALLIEQKRSVVRTLALGGVWIMPTGKGVKLDPRSIVVKFKADS